jgi:hypothetical protein
MPDPNTFQSLSAELNRSLLGGGRLPKPGAAGNLPFVSFARVTGQAMVAPEDLSTHLTLAGSIDGIERIAVERPADRIKGAFLAARQTVEHLSKLVSPLSTPIWTLHPTELTVGDPGDLFWERNGAQWPVVRLGPGVLSEIESSPAETRAALWRYRRDPEKPITKPEGAALASSDWNACLCAEFSARVFNDRIELLGAPETERLLLDKLVRRLQTAPVFDLVCLLRDDSSASENSGPSIHRLAVGAATVVARTNLSRRARPFQPPTVRLMESEEEPYVAAWGENPRDFIRLLRLSGITNRGGYFLSGAGGMPHGDGKLYTLVLAFVLQTPLQGDVDNGFSWPSWANGLSIAPPPNPKQETWHALRFHGTNHWRIETTAPPGAAAFAWRVPQPAQRPLSLLGAQLERMVSNRVNRDDIKLAASGAIPSTIRGAINALRKAPNLSAASNKALSLLESADGFHNATQLLDFEIDGVTHTGQTLRLLSCDECIPAPPDTKQWQEKAVTAVLEGFNRPSSAGAFPAAIANPDVVAKAAEPANAPKDWTYRMVQPVPLGPGEAQQNSYAHLAKFRSLVLTAGFRDVYGNRLSERLAPMEIPLFYTDRLISPASWPLFTAQLEVDGAGKKIHLNFTFAGLGERPEKPEDLKKLLERADEQRRAFQQSFVQINGSDGADLTVALLLQAVRANGEEAFTIELDVKARLLKQLQAIIAAYDRFKGDASTLPGAIAEKIEIPLRPVEQLRSSARLVPTLQIKRTKFLPPDEYLKSLAAVANEGEIVSISMPVRILGSTARGESDALPQTATELQSCLPSDWRVRVGHRRDASGMPEYWLVPRTALPIDPANLFYWTARPWRTKLEGGDFPIPAFDQPFTPDGEAIKDYPLPKITFSAQDVDGAARTALAFLTDLVREPNTAIAPKFRDLLGSIDHLASFLGGPSFVVPLFADANANPDAGASASDVLVDAVRSDLRAFYQVDTLVQFDLYIPRADESIAAFHGNIVAAWSSAAPNPSFSDFRIVNKEKTHLSFNYDLPPGAAYDRHILQSLAFNITHVQLTDPTAAKTDFAAGKWLQLVPSPPVPLAQSLVIPAITREFPSAPIIRGAAWQASALPPEPLQSVRPLLEVTAKVNLELLNPAPTDDVLLEPNFNPDVSAGSFRLLSEDWWISDFHALLVLNALSAHFYGKLDSASRPAALPRVIALSATAVEALVRKLKEMAPETTPAAGLHRSLLPTRFPGACLEHRASCYYTGGQSGAGSDTSLGDEAFV